MTGEDNIHQGTVESFFQTSLRPDTTTNSNLQTKKLSSENEPSFFGADIEKWLSKKFS